MPQITLYMTPTCSDCCRVKQFLRDRGVEFREVNISEDHAAEELVLRVNHGRRRVPTIELDGRYVTCTPFDPHQLAAELGILLNPSR
jgi:glutaredoxin